MKKTFAQAFKAARPVLWDVLPAYTMNFARRDLFSGLTVAIVALPLALAFAIASGVGPERGLFTAIIAGFFISFFGGSRLQIGGPTGAFVAVLYMTVERHGYEGLVLATLMAGVILIGLGLARLGNFIKYIPYPVITGFTSGIAVIIFTTQIRDFFGLQMEKMPGDFMARLEAFGQAAGTVNTWALVVGVVTMAIILLVRKVKPQIPGAILAVIATAVAVHVLNLPVETIASRFGSLPTSLPTPMLPDITPDKLRAVLPDAVTIALLAGIESLLSALIADGMTGDRHKSNTELVGQGIANMVSAICGGIAATGAIARTGVNVKTGAATPVSGMLHALFLLLFVLVAAPLAGAIPLATLAGILFVASWDMAHWGLFARQLRAPHSDVLVLLLTFALTILIDITVAVEVGVVLAALLFMKRMSDVAEIHTGVEATADDYLHDPASKPNPVDVPEGVQIYKVSGPFFFGAASKMAEMLHRFEHKPKVLILRIKSVPVIDATGLHMLEQVVDKFHKQGTTVILAGVQPQVQKALQTMGLDQKIGVENILASTALALKRAKVVLPKARKS